MAQDAQLLAELNVAEADAAIAAWNSKYTYNAWRPIAAIQDANQIVNAGITQDPNWQPLITTPPFPEYVAGHPTFSAAAAQILDSFFGSNYSFSYTDGSLGSTPGVTVSFTSFDQAAQQAGESRVYGSIHFQFSVDAGLTVGQEVGDWTLNVFNQSQDTVPPKIVLNQTSGLVTNTDPTITGDVTENLSGVTSLAVSLDGGSATNVSFDANGNFSVPASLPTDGTADGHHTLTFTAVDAAGNVTSPLTFDFMLDTKAPQITLAASSVQDGGALAAGAELAGTAATETDVALAGLSYAFDGGTPMPIQFDPSTGDFTQSLDVSRLSVGAHTLAVTATDTAGNTSTETVNLSLPTLAPLTITKVTPIMGAGDVGVTYRPQVNFSRAVDPTTLTSSSFYATDTTGAIIPATIVTTLDDTGVWLFFTNPLPGASTITIHVNGEQIKAQADGALLDAAGTGNAGSDLTESFTTVSTAPVPNTTITGIVVDPGPDLTPFTPDDVKFAADGVTDYANDVWKLPIAGVKVFVLGHEDQAVYTDAQGRFTLTNVPTGDVKIEFDGTTATNPPSGVYFPTMVMDTTIRAGVANTIMGSMGTADQQAAGTNDPAVYLPRLSKSLLTTVSNSSGAIIHTDPTAAPQLTPEQASELTLDIPAGAPIGADGQPLSSAQVGISMVPVSLIESMLPPGLSGIKFAMTIQAPGVAKFATPIKATFPNVYNAAPGTKLNVFSFDHATGQLVFDGFATVSADGKTVVTDPDSGVPLPSWGFVAPPGVNVNGSFAALFAQR